MLSLNEKNNLYTIITAIIGEDPAIKAWKNRFNENTISVVEDMVIANINCNSNMKSLVQSLVGASSLITKGWLKKILKESNGKISSTQFKGYGCKVLVKIRWKTAIINSAI